MTTPIQRAVYELDVAGLLAKPNGAQSIQDARDIIKRELEKAVPELPVESEFDSGWNACLREIVGEK